MQIPAPTIRFSARRAAAFGAIFSAALLALPSAASAAPLWPDSPESPTAKIAFELFIVVFAIGVIALVAYTLSLREAARTEVDADAPAVADNSAKRAVIAGTAVFLVLAVLGGLSFAKTSSAEKSKTNPGKFFKATVSSQPGLKVAHVVKAPAGAAYSIKVNAQQFLWRYEYSGIKSRWNTYSYNELVLPAGVTVLLDFTSSDAEAAWWVPQLGGSITAMPGYANKVWLRADKPGFYTGSGTVVNGTNYSNMITNVTVVAPEVFARWVVGKQIEIDRAMTALGLERASGEEAQLITGEKGAAAGTAKSEIQQTQAADGEGKN